MKENKKGVPKVIGFGGILFFLCSLHFSSYFLSMIPFFIDGLSPSLLKAEKSRFHAKEKRMSRSHSTSAASFSDVKKRSRSFLSYSASSASTAIATAPSYVLLMYSSTTLPFRTSMSFWNSGLSSVPAFNFGTHGQSTAGGIRSTGKSCYG